MIRRLIKRLRGKPDTNPPGVTKNWPSSPEVWHTGDIAESLVPKDGWESRTGTPFPNGPDKGETFRVMQTHWNYGCQQLEFSRWPTFKFDAAAFRKVLPRADEATAADADFINTLTPANAAGHGIGGQMRDQAPVEKD